MAEQVPWEFTAAIVDTYAYADVDDADNADADNANNADAKY